MKRKKTIKAGKFPYLSGIYPEMYQTRLWTMRQYSGFGSAKQSNDRYQKLIAQGSTGLSVAFDLPTQMGLDSDSLLAEGEVGRVGVSISTIEDMRILLKDLPLEKISISMTINSTAAIILAFLLEVAREQKISWKKLSGTIQNDILKEYIARGTFIYPPKPALRLVTDIFSFCNIEVPKWNTISISGYHIREAGSTLIDELSFTFANAIVYIEHAIKAGLKIDDFAPRLSFFFNCHNGLFEEAAKFRAARVIWAKLLKKRFKAKNEASLKLRFHTQTAGSSLTDSQPLNNVVRCAYQALSAVMGGTQSLHVNGFDEARALPTEASAVLALRTQQILGYETGVSKIIDPLYGSVYVEELTLQIEKAVTKRISEIDNLGGMLDAIESGFVSEQIERSAYLYQKEIEANKNIIVGLNKFYESEKIKIPLQRIDPKLERAQASALAKYKRNRDQQKVKAATLRLKKSAQSEVNLMAEIILAARAKMTLGEISQALKEVFGEYVER